MTEEEKKIVVVDDEARVTPKLLEKILEEHGKTTVDGKIVDKSEVCYWPAPSKSDPTLLRCLDDTIYKRGKHGELRRVTFKRSEIKKRRRK